MLIGGAGPDTDRPVVVFQTCELVEVERLNHQLRVSVLLPLTTCEDHSVEL